jgi:hypothetical protein
MIQNLSVILKTQGQEAEFFNYSPIGGGGFLKKTQPLKFSENWVLVIASRVGACVFRTLPPLSPQTYICSRCGNHIDSAYDNEKQHSNKQLHLKASSLLW